MSANGNWTMTVQSPMGAQQGTLAITVEGATFKGTQTSATFGSSDIEGTVEGDTLKWASKVTSPMPMTLEHTITFSGDTLSGSVKAGAFGTFSVTGARA